MKTEIKFVAEDRSDMVNISRMLNVNALYCEIEDFEQYLRNLYKYSEWEHDETLALVENIRERFRETIGQCLEE